MSQGIRQGRLEDKVVIITGGAQGIGYAVAALAQAEGAHVVIADVQDGKGKETALSVGGTFVHLDVTDETSVRQAVDSVAGEYGRIDVLVNNAGAGLVAPAAETSSAQFRQLLDIDLTGMFTVAREVGRHMTEAGRGSIVNLSSIAAFTGIPKPAVAYSAAKAGAAQMARSLASEWACHGSRVAESFQDSLSRNACVSAP